MRQRFFVDPRLAAPYLLLLAGCGGGPGPVVPEDAPAVSYDQVTGNRFRHGTKLIRFRPDKAPRQCTLEQIAPAAKSAKLIAGMLKS